MNRVLFLRERMRKRRQERAERLLQPFVAFANGQSVGGQLLLIATVAAIVFANVPALHFLNDIWGVDFSLSFNHHDSLLPIHTLGGWVNEGLMVIFFFSVGLEIKREIMVGELSIVRNALLPVLAAAGGMLFPMLIYVGINHGGGADMLRGFGIPTVTDIAFTIAILAALGSRIPIALKVFLTALAIVDDLGAIIMLAVAYPTHSINGHCLAAAGGITVALMLLNYYRVNRSFPYVLLGIMLWFFVAQSGVHATIAGVVLALTIPTKMNINKAKFFSRSTDMLVQFKEAHHASTPFLRNEKEQEQVHNLQREINRFAPLIMRMERSVQPWVTFCILPLFALANAGVQISGVQVSELLSPAPLGIYLGLLLGKPLGITVFSWLAVKLRLGAMPANTSWRQIFGAGILAGIGFTMAIFVDSIAFAAHPDLRNVGKLAIMLASVSAAVIGFVYMKAVCKVEDGK